MWPMRKTLPLSGPWPGRERDPEPVAQVEQELPAVDAVGHADSGHDRRAVVVGREELEAHRLDPLTAGAAEADVALEGGLEAPLEDHAERDVEADDERDGRRERRIERLLRLARALPVEVEPRGFASSRASQAASETETIARPGGAISAFCEPETTTSSAQASVSQRDRAEARDRVDSDERPASLAAAAKRTNVGNDSRGRLGLGHEDGFGAAELGQARREILGRWASRPTRTGCARPRNRRRPRYRAQRSPK